MKNVTRLTNDGDNGEAYFSWDGKKLIFQSSREGYACDKIWTMNIDGSDKRMVSPDHGAQYLLILLPDGRIVFASTSHLPGDCPPRPETPKGARYVWPLYPYDIFTANADGSDLTKLTDNPKYDAEPVVSSDGKQIVFGSQREGNFDVYVMNADGTNVRRLTDRTGYNGGPWFSPDNTKIVWRAWYPETEAEKAQWKDCMEKNYILAFPLDLWVMDADGSNKRMILHNGATNFAPSWHPGRQAHHLLEQHGRLARGHQTVRPQLRALPDQSRRHRTWSGSRLTRPSTASPCSRRTERNWSLPRTGTRRSRTRRTSISPTGWSESNAEFGLRNAE